MSVSPDEAADALRQIAAVETHSQRVYGYREASPHLIVWGVLWAIGYGLTAAIPRHVSGIDLDRGHHGWTDRRIPDRAPHGRPASRPACRSDQAHRRAVARLRRIFNGASLTASVFVTASLVVMSPVSPHQIGAFIALVVGASYSVLGLWVGVRFIAIGTALAVLTLGGFLLLPGHFELWMAAVGGGALLVGGLWLRRV